MDMVGPLPHNPKMWFEPEQFEKRFQKIYQKTSSQKFRKQGVKKLLFSKE